MDKLTKEAILRAGAAANPEWRLVAFKAIERLAKRGAEFTADDIWAEIAGKAETHEPRALGAMMKRAHKLGVIVATGEVAKTKKRGSHSHWQTVWIGGKQ